ncbi:leucyl aminopeptidase family protein [Flavobacterium crassostreae]|uniref:Leucyl aminopeptidase n=1 Tax=Flavobacterium crassostreae TaxID=1763534 RepID=A0A1B9E2C6_9FLAO|nr:leucyl aminopeptidase family protein [Flavobacterium crassostreae]OCB76076.1 leucyl aminopeptidase [Flavobacterium crassostreae]
MKTKHTASLKDFSGTVLVPVFETTAQNLIPIQFEGLEISSKVFFGKKDTYYLAEKNGTTYVFIGLGKETEYKSLKNSFRRIASKEKDFFAKTIALVLPKELVDHQVEALILGLFLATYSLGHYKKEKTHPFLKSDFVLEIVSSNQYTASIEKALKIARAQLETLRLVDLPPNKITPKYLAEWATATGNKYGFSTTVLGKEACEIEQLGAFLAVGKGSQNEPQFVIMTYAPKTAAPNLQHLGLVGKGVTFDTGGLNIKTAGMLDMKSDMAGAAAVFGAMQLIADLQVPIRVTAVVPCAENAVSSTSFLPSDVIKSYSGNSIEIIDTDAEGRLLLADGLSYLIKNFHPDYVVDIATLTGSSIGTFGHECAALFTNNSLVSASLQQAGDSIGERMWPLPLWEAYDTDITSEIADVRNYSGKPMAGAITAAKFLEYFTQKHPAWAHLDIAGVAYGNDEFAKSKHATAYGVHLLTKFAENL